MSFLSTSNSQASLFELCLANLSNCKVKTVPQFKTFQARVSTLPEWKDMMVLPPPVIYLDPGITAKTARTDIKQPLLPLMVRLPGPPLVVEDIQNATPTGAQLASKLAQYFEHKLPKGRVSVTPVGIPTPAVPPPSKPSTSTAIAAAKVRGCKAADRAKTLHSQGMPYSLHSGSSCFTL